MTHTNTASDYFSGYNVNTIAIEVPITMLTSTGAFLPATSPRYHWRMGRHRPPAYPDASRPASQFTQWQFLADRIGSVIHSSTILIIGHRFEGLSGA